MKRYKFEAVIHEGRGGGAFVFFPYDVEKEFATKGRVPVKATFEGVPYAGSLAKYGAPQHLLGVSKAIREQLGKKPGDSVQVVLWKDDEIRTVEIPPELKKAFEKARLLPTFEKLSYTHRKEYCRWIDEAKKDETRVRRMEKAVEMLRKGIKTPLQPGTPS